MPNAPDLPPFAADSPKIPIFHLWPKTQAITDGRKPDYSIDEK
jgi:hypothetical protein